MDFVIDNIDINLEKTLLSGQCFRWEHRDGGFFGISGGKSVFVKEEKNGLLLSVAASEDESYWRAYFDADNDYAKAISRFREDETLRLACECGSGLRLLRQEPFETLISFIISQNNNIPRIRGIIARLCESFGERVEGGYAFPSAERLAALSAEELAPLRAGFRARYILDAAKKVQSGALDLSAINGMPYADALASLKTVVGVGDKVADCVLLFAYGMHEAFPKDVWIKRALAEYYPDGLPDCARGNEGLAQQFLFEYIRARGAERE